MIKSSDNYFPFKDRKEAGEKLALKFKGKKLRNPVVLAIPRGGVITGVALAKALGAELDVVLARKLRAPFQPELALGAVGEDGEVYLDKELVAEVDVDIEKERKYQLSEIARRQKLFRAVRPAAEIKDRSVIVTDDGIATGSTMIAALHVLSTKEPHEIIVAVPVAAPRRLEVISNYCDQVICLIATENFYAVGQFYEDFSPVEDQEAIELLGSLYKKDLPKSK